MSRTKELIEEALDKLEKYLEEKYVKEDLAASSMRRTGINRYLNRLGIHILRSKEWDIIQQALTQSTSSFGKLSSFQFLTFAMQNPESFDLTYKLLNDEQSKSTFDWYIRYRTAYAFVGEEAYNIFTPPITRERWNDLQKMITRSSDRYFEIQGFKIEAGAFELIGTFIIEQYRYLDTVKPMAGDIVLDIGAYVGDTTLWFVKQVSPNGLVYAFEPDSNNFSKLLHNISLNKVASVIPVNLAFSDTEGIKNFVGGGEGATIASSGEGKQTEVTTVDSFVTKNMIPKIDFIKMDVEGHEMNILRGAAATIKTFSPKMAISVYHRGDDLVVIPQYLLSLNSGYKFYLRHCTPIWGDTVLYGTTSPD